MAPPKATSHNRNHAPGILSGALIACENGNVAIETVNIGDIVNTLSDGPQVVRWVGSTKLDSPAVQFQTGALREVGPTHTLLVSPTQRIVVSGWQAEVLFGEARVLIAAEALLNGDNICLVSAPKESKLFHILFDKHETIDANGVPTESLYPSKAALNSLPAKTRAALYQQVPELSSLDPIYPFALVHPEISAAEAALLR